MFAGVVIFRRDFQITLLLVVYCSQTNKIQVLIQDSVIPVINILRTGEAYDINCNLYHHFRYCSPFELSFWQNYLFVINL